MSEGTELPIQATVKIDPGVCRLPSTIQARTDGVFLEFEILHSDCPQVRKLNSILRRMDIWDVMRMPFSENTVYQICGEALKHSSCPVPMAMIKCAEVATELALKRPVLVEFID
ncbi:MAG: hypothetical protein MIO90_07335 [Methanomassiliicoccales archaeon]|nr:hypothetical protein [Methanomassiliicoccales archaeon]